MSDPKIRREALVDRLAEHLLQHGLAGASLRPLAKAVGTSDRMLLYYFADKDALLTATLERVALRFGEILDAAMPADKRFAPAMLFAMLWQSMRSPALKPYMRIWLELAAGAAAGEALHDKVGGAIADRFAGWAASHLAIDDEAERARQAALLLGTVDGLLLLDTLGRPDLADLAASAFGAA